MLGNVVVRSGPGAEPISLIEAKLHCRADADLTDEDSLITGLISAARSHAESATNRRIVTQGLHATFAGFPCMIDLAAPARKVTSVIYLDSAGASQTLAASNYVVDLAELPGKVSLAYGYSWPCTYEHPAAATVNFTAGDLTPFTVNVTSNVLTAAGHPFANGDVVRGINTGGALPAGMVASTDYYAVGVSGDTLQVSATSGGAAVDLTGTGTGTNFLIGPDDTAWLAMRQAMLLMIAHWYARREESSDFQAFEIPMGAAAILAPHKVWGC